MTAALETGVGEASLLALSSGLSSSPTSEESLLKEAVGFAAEHRFYLRKDSFPT